MGSIVRLLSLSTWSFLQLLTLLFTVWSLPQTFKMGTIVRLHSLSTWSFLQLLTLLMPWSELFSWLWCTEKCQAVRSHFTHFLVLFLFWKKLIKWAAGVCVSMWVRLVSFHYNFCNTLQQLEQVNCRPDVAHYINVVHPSTWAMFPYRKPQVAKPYPLCSFLKMIS